MAYQSEYEQPDFGKMSDGLIPAIVQDAQTDQVLMLGFMNAEALAATRSSGFVTFFSRSKQRLWTKGETSGNFLLLQEVMMDCDRDTLLLKAIPKGPSCHTGADTCFNETNQQSGLEFLDTIIQDRKKNPKKGGRSNGRKS